MSFNAEPFSECTIVFNGDTTMEIRCDSCGGGHQRKFQEDDTLYTFQEAYYEHLNLSHDLKPKCGYVRNINPYVENASGFLKCTLDIHHQGKHHLEMVNQDSK